jgi:prepilin peptidase CpaA
MSGLFTVATVVLLATAAWHDIATRTIPDSIGLTLAGMGVLARALLGPTALSLSVATAIVIFGLLLAAYTRGLIGGGDVKIISALAVGLPPFDTYCFVVATAIAGGVLAIAYLGLSRVLRPRFIYGSQSIVHRVVAIECWRIRRQGPLPYGVAIAVGGTFVLLQPGIF